MAKKLQVEWDSLVGPAANARRHLPPLASAYFVEARTMLAEAEEPAKLHRLRLISKRLRYTLELFQPCYGPGIDLRLQALKRVQDLLGEINDAVIAASLIEYLPNSVRMKRYLHERAARKAAAFRIEWQQHFDARGQEGWWTSYLATGTRQQASAAEPSPELRKAATTRAHGRAGGS
jgi:CHAD domain-containing protein